MKNQLPILLFAAASCCFAFQNAEAARWEKEAKSVTIIRDDWGIAHVHGKTDADAVFGMIYAQAEDDFNRVETNYINAMGRLAEAEGESKIYQDLRMKIFIDPAELKKEYAASPAWLQALMNAFADGLNFYLAKHPDVHPRVIQRFEPWMALSFTEGSIGGDIERINLNQLQAFYGKAPVGETSAEVEDELYAEPSGSNGGAVAPSNTLGHHALLLINPHTSFFFRSELQMTSDEGLNAYGAATWGQFFIYQGFNARTGWMHTSSGVDAVDEYLETVTRKGNAFFYKYGNEEKPFIAGQITVKYKTERGMEEKLFTVFRTHHGPIVREVNGKWVSIRLMQEHIKALEQSYTRTKQKDYKSYRETMELKANSSNNTIFADADGDIAYFHGNFIPKRDTAFDWTRPVDGTTPATEWKGPSTKRPICSIRSPAGCTTPTTGHGPPRVRAVRRGRTIPSTSKTEANPRAACTPSASSKIRRISRSIRSSPPPSTVISPGSKNRCPRSSRPGTPLPTAILSKPKQPTKLRSFASGISGGPRTPCPHR